MQDIFNELRLTDTVDAKFLENTIRRHNKNLPTGTRHFAKKMLFPFYLRVKETEPERWASWNVDEELERRFVRMVQVKPRRTASGVATITVLTKPWKCASSCLYCPNDLRMPKSYLTDEPACQRAERNWFDPYLQVGRRLRTLVQMGHVTDKVELIVLGGTWSDYPHEYRLWFISELFRALNDGVSNDVEMQERCEFYRTLGLLCEREDLAALTAESQHQIETGVLTYNQAMVDLYEQNPIWQHASASQIATMSHVQKQQAINERAEHRCVGLVVETRPDRITAESLTELRELGCTKVQMGIQSLEQRILDANRRGITTDRIRESFELLRVFGFKIHTHFMVNLYGTDPANDMKDYEALFDDAAFRPDEVKLYPCSLVAGTGLCQMYASGEWRPYTEEELVNVLSHDTLYTPRYARISRMIRDISSHDIVAGNKKVNLRQMVQQHIEAQGAPIHEIRYREISTGEADIDDLQLRETPYKTTVSEEVFLEWTTPDDKIAGFLRLSMPHNDYVRRNAEALPVGTDEAMIREVHVYGRVAGIHKAGAAQHLGLGKQLIARACTIAQEHGYHKMNVISAIGTREYYRSLGFSDNGLYQQLALDDASGSDTASGTSALGFSAVVDAASSSPAKPPADAATTSAMV